MIVQFKIRLYSKNILNTILGDPAPLGPFPGYATGGREGVVTFRDACV